MADLEKRLQQSIDKKTQRGGEWNKLLEKEAQKLYDQILLAISDYYLSYDPVAYKRTYDMINSLRLKVSGDEFIIYFEPNAAYHPNVFVQTLMDHGWNYSNAKYRFTYWDGAHFIEQGIANYKKYDAAFPIEIKIESKYYPEYYNTLG